VKTLAIEELAAPEDPQAQLSVADAWWNVAEQRSGITQTQIRRHAAEWYTRVAPRLFGLNKQRVEKRLAVLGSVDAGVTAANASSVPKPVKWRKWHTLEPATSVNFSPDGARLVTGSSWMHMNVWDVEKGILVKSVRIRVPDNPATEVSSPCYSADGKSIAVGVYRLGQVDIWDADSLTLVKTLTGHKSEIEHVEYSRNGEVLLTSSRDGVVRTWNAVSGEELHQFRAVSLSNVGCMPTISPDGRLVAAATKETPNAITLWKADTGQVAEELAARNQTGLSLAFSPDGRRLISACSDNDIQMWDVESCKELLVLKGHTDIVRRVAYSPDGELIASCSHDGTVRLWEAATGQAVCVLSGHSGAVYDVAYGSSSKRIASCSGKETIIWDADVKGD